MKAFVAGVKFTDPAKGKGGERDFIGLEPPLPPHERRNRMHIEFEESDYELFKKVFEDEDTATAAMRIIYNAPPEIQILAVQLIKMIEEV